MFQLRQSGPTCGDCTSSYRVEFDYQYRALHDHPTVEQFIDHIITNRADEWGFIDISVPGTELKGSVSYSHGKLEEASLPWNIGKKRIDTVTANGGWTKMDYCVTLKPAKDSLTIKESSMVCMDATHLYLENEGVVLADLLEAISTGLVGRHGDIRIDGDDTGLNLEWKYGMEIDFDIPEYWMYRKVQECKIKEYWRDCSGNFEIILEE